MPESSFSTNRISTLSKLSIETPIDVEKPFASQQPRPKTDISGRTAFRLTNQIGKWC